MTSLAFGQVKRTKPANAEEPNETSAARPRLIALRRSGSRAQTMRSSGRSNPPNRALQSDFASFVSASATTLGLTSGRHSGLKPC